MNLKSTAANGFNCQIINSLMASWEVCMTWRDCAVDVSWFDYSWAVNTSNLGSVGSSLRQETSSCLAFLHPGIWMGTTDIFWGPGAAQEWTTILHKIDGKLRTSLLPKSRKGKWQILASAQLTICIFFYVNCMRGCSHSMVTTFWYKFILIHINLITLYHKIMNFIPVWKSFNCISTKLYCYIMLICIKLILLFFRVLSLVLVRILNLVRFLNWWKQKR